MTPPGDAATPVGDARLALNLLAIAPRLGGACLRGGWALRDALLADYRAALPVSTRWRRLPPHMDPERLHGGVDLVASLTAGRTVLATGLVDEAAGGVIVAPMAERLAPAIAGPLAQALDRTGDAVPILILTDDGTTDDEHPPAALLDRLAFHIDLSGAEAGEPVISKTRKGSPIDTVAPVEAAGLETIATIATALGVHSGRALLFAALTARAHAALKRRTTVEDVDLVAAARLVLAPRATQLPAPPEIVEPSPPSDTLDHQGEEDRADDGQTPRDLVLEAAVVAIPADLLKQLGAGRSRTRSKPGGGGRRGPSGLRGKPLSARPGLPRDGARLALIDTLRAAIPWQAVRKVEGEDHASLIRVRKADLRVRRFEQRSIALTIFCVDASGSAAVARLAEAKGAVERLLAEAYVHRSEVALIAFRGAGAELLLPPTRSLTRARRALADLPGGGGTPLAAGIGLARQLGETATARGRSPMLVFLTDGSANIARDGTGGRGQAQDEALDAAKALSATGIDTLLIDISPRPKATAEQLAVAMRARYLPLPLARSDAIGRAIHAARQPSGKA